MSFKDFLRGIPIVRYFVPDDEPQPHPHIRQPVLAQFVGGAADGKQLLVYPTHRVEIPRGCSAKFEDGFCYAEWHPGVDTYELRLDGKYHCIEQWVKSAEEATIISRMAIYSERPCSNCGGQVFNWHCQNCCLFQPSTSPEWNNISDADKAFYERHRSEGTD